MKLPTLKEEKDLWQKGYRYVVGLDEAGRGSWAGPVVAAAVIFPTNCRASSLTPAQISPLRIRDSKQLRGHQRAQLDEFIRRNCLAFTISEISVKTINREGIVKASQRAFRKCLKEIRPVPDFVLIDAFFIKHLAKKNQKPIIKGDQKSLSIAAASIVAKVYRDNLMVKLHQADPRYHFDLHKGYGTKIHQEAIRKYGLSRDHRNTFVPKDLV